MTNMPLPQDGVSLTSKTLMLLGARARKLMGVCRTVKLEQRSAQFTRRDLDNTSCVALHTSELFGIELSGRAACAGADGL